MKQPRQPESPRTPKKLPLIASVLGITALSLAGCESGNSASALEVAKNQALHFHVDETLNVLPYSVPIDDTIHVTTSPDNSPSSNFAVPNTGLVFNNTQVIYYNGDPFLSGKKGDEALFINVKTNKIPFMTRLNDPKHLTFNYRATEPALITSFDPQTGLPQVADGTELVQVLEQQDSIVLPNS